jgi:hypothetical protein
MPIIGKLTRDVFETPIPKKNKENFPGICVFCGIAMIVTTILSCSKNEIQKNDRRYDAYKLTRDWYTLDTEFVNRAILWEDDSIWRNETKLALDTASDEWWLMCGTERFPLHIEHWYYMKNGKRIHPSVYPKT